LKRVVIPIHGIMMDPPGYSVAWKHILNTSPNYIWKEFYWDTLNSKAWDHLNHVERYLRWLKSGIIKRLCLEIFDHWMDALRYSLEDVKKPAIKLLGDFINEQGKDADEIIILAHSLGSVLAFETLQILPNEITSKIKLISFGTPLSNEFERDALEVSPKAISCNLWVNLHGNWTDMVGGRPLKFSNFDPKNDYALNVSHDDLKYLKAAKDLLTKLIFNTDT
jgi:pimeloyl-ACP methyl ester carboxylesterase